MADKLRKFKTYRQEDRRDQRRNNKWQGQIEARLESDRTEIEQEATVQVSTSY